VKKEKITEFAKGGHRTMWRDYRWRVEFRFQARGGKGMVGKTGKKKLASHETGKGPTIEEGRGRAFSTR